ncbi:hypothetical protein [Flavobacterium sp.]|uniref:hypothetical protein n=1 Tax=Flavobacterium sp. TaxID=239 RepID=UPI003D6C223E
MIRIIEKITEIIGWFQIAISPTLIGLGLGCILYYNFQNTIGLIFGILIAVIGLFCGVALATNKYNTTGTVSFLSKVNASPDLDKFNKTEKRNLKSKDLEN